MNITGIDALYYLAKDLDRATAFYRDTLGLKPSAGAVAEFALPDGSTFGLYKPEDGGWHASGGVMFAVADAAAAVRELRERGVTMVDPLETPACFMGFGEDTEGNGFIIHQRKK